MVLTTVECIICNGLMSRRTVILIVVFLGALLAGNIVILGIWLPIWKSRAANVQSANRTTVSSPATPSEPKNNPPLAPAGTAAPSSDLVLERQFTSQSGNLQIKYLRDRKTKIRRITVEDAHRPGVTAVLCEWKQPAWALVSPDDQWIAVNQRHGAGGGVRLYRRGGTSLVQYDSVEGTGPQDSQLQEMIWQNYLRAMHADSGTPRRGATIDATAWENDSRKLDVSVVFLSTPQNSDVPEPWRCTYDVASKQIEPAPDQPAPTEMADNSANAQASEQSNGVAENAQNSETANTEDNEFPGEKFPATRLDELSVPDVSDSSLSEITYAINEMFARHGAEFKEKKVTKQFEQFSWYTPRPGLSLDDIETEFSDLEKQNLKVLGRCRDAKLAAAKHKSRPVRGQPVQEESVGEKVMRGIRAWQDAGGPMPPHP
jgi:YARHG domain